MTGIENVTLQQVIVHKVGNPSRNEELKFSANALTLNDDVVSAMLTKYFLSPFNENEHYHFTHLSDLSMNEVYNYVTNIFEDSKSFNEESIKIASFLYSKSTHVKVKEGELYVAVFDNVMLGGETHKAIGLFKSETKETFLKVFPHGQSWEVIQDEGIDINKLDKGCLIFNTNQNDGYTVCVVDKTNKQNDTRYWITDFLQVEPTANDYHNTDQYLGLCKLFIDNEYAEKFDVSKSDQVDLMNRSMEYFKTKDQFNMQEFAEEVIHHPEVVDTFMEYKQQYQKSRNFEIEDDFDISLSAVKKQDKNFKSVIKLDKNFSLYIHGRKDLMEKGYDEMTGKKFYKLYYEEES
jgi:hypothetical protein